jgi:hypothetical protein
MIGQTHGYDMGNLMQMGDNIHFRLYGVGLDNRHDLAIREHSMDLNTVDGGQNSGNCFGLTLYARYYDT